MSIHGRKKLVSPDLPSEWSTYIVVGIMCRRPFSTASPPWPPPWPRHPHCPRPPRFARTHRPGARQALRQTGPPVPPAVSPSRAPAAALSTLESSGSPASRACCPPHVVWMNPRVPTRTARFQTTRATRSSLSDECSPVARVRPDGPRWRPGARAGTDPPPSPSRCGRCDDY